MHLQHEPAKVRCMLTGYVTAINGKERLQAWYKKAADELHGLRWQDMFQHACTLHSRRLGMLTAHEQLFAKPCSGASYAAYVSLPMSGLCAKLRFCTQICKRRVVPMKLFASQAQAETTRNPTRTYKTCMYYVQQTHLAS